MSEKMEPQEESVFQRLFDRPFILLTAGILIMALFYTGWGLYEILSLPASALP